MYQKFWISGKSCPLDKDGDEHLWPQRSHSQELHSISFPPGPSGPILECNSWCTTGIFVFLSTISKKVCVQLQSPYWKSGMNLQSFKNFRENLAMP